MAETEPETVRRWLERAASGDAESWRLLLAGHHNRLWRMVAVRIDPRLQGRLDPSDVLQEAYLEASRQLGDFLRKEDVPFILWPRGLVRSRLARLHRHHLGTRRRDAGREVSLDREPAPDASSAVLAACLIGAAERPSEEAVRAELRERLQAVLERLSPEDREVVSLRHFEQLSTEETAAVLGISAAAAGKRYVRALTRLRRLLADDPDVLRGWRP